MKFRWGYFVVAAGLSVAAVLLLNVMFINDPGPFGPRYRSNTFESAVPLSFAGTVEDFNASRGLHVKLDNDLRWFNLSGACNDRGCLNNVIRIGDSMRKDSGLPAVYVIRRGKASVWFLEWEDRLKHR